MLLLIIIALILAVSYLLINKPYQYWKKCGVLYIKPVPFFGNMWEFIGKGMSSSDWLQNIYNKYDTRYFGIYQYFSPILFIKDINLIKQIAIKDFENFSSHKDFFSISASKEPVFRHNLFALKGQEWKEMRATVSPAYTTSKLREMFQLISTCSKQYVDHLVENTSETTTVLQMYDFFNRYTSDIIASCGFGIQCNSIKDKSNEFYKRSQHISDFGGSMVYKLIGFTISPELMDYFRIRLFAKDVVNWFQEFVATTRNFRKENNITRYDMIHLLLKANKEKVNSGNYKNKSDNIGFDSVEETDFEKSNSTQGSKLTDDEITAQVILFFIAAMETVSSSLSFLAYELAINEEIQRKLQTEIDEVIEENSGQLNYEVILKMKYLNMVLNEVLRKWPSVFYLHRECNSNYTIPAINENEKPVHLKKGDTVWFPTFCIQRDPKYFPNPDKFDPERFNDENKRNINPLACLTFGIGPRYCIGSRFALLEMKSIFVYLLWKFNIIVVKETQIPVKLHKKKLLLGSEDGIMLGLQLRNK